MDPVLHHATCVDGLVGSLLAGRPTRVYCVHLIIRNAQLSKLTVNKVELLAIVLLLLSGSSLSTAIIYVVSAIPAIISLVMRHSFYLFTN